MADEEKTEEETGSGITSVVVLRGLKDAVAAHHARA